MRHATFDHDTEAQGPAEPYDLSVLDTLMAEAQPNYVGSVSECLLYLVETLGQEPFAGIGKEEFTDRALDAVIPGEGALGVATWLCQLNWWCGLPISDEAYGRIGAIARASIGQAMRAIQVPDWPPNPKALRAHTVFAGAFMGVLHSPTRGAIAYARALASQPNTDAVDVLHAGAMSPQLQEHAAEALGPLAAKVRFREVIEGDDSFLVEAIQGWPRTFHIWCEPTFSLYPSLLSLFGPTVYFVCGDAVPVQYSDVYWFCHQPEYIAEQWGRRGTPQAFVDNYRQMQSLFYTPFTPQRTRTRDELGFGPDDIVLATVGNRLGVDMCQTYVDGMAAIVLQDPRLKWLFVGPLQDYWISALESVLGDQFSHISFDNDLPSLLAHVDIFANPFRAGGGNTAVMAMQVGAVVLTRGDVGDVPVLVPPAHWMPDAATYFERLSAMVDDPAQRDAWRAEQGAFLDGMLDPKRVGRELGEVCRLAFERFRARSPVRLDKILAQ